MDVEDFKSSDESDETQSLINESKMFSRGTGTVGSSFFNITNTMFVS